MIDRFSFVHNKGHKVFLSCENQIKMRLKKEQERKIQEEKEIIRDKNSSRKGE